MKSSRSNEQNKIKGLLVESKNTNKTQMENLV